MVAAACTGGSGRKEKIMDEQRFQTLSKKRNETGLSEEEADELGRMFAEREGADYSNAETTTSGEAEDEEKAAEMKTRHRDESVKDEVRDEEVEEDLTSTNPA
jgi:hypothetical protein